MATTTDRCSEQIGPACVIADGLNAMPDGGPCVGCNRHVWLNIRQTAHILGIHENTVRNNMDRGAITFKQLPGSNIRRVYAASLLAFVSVNENHHRLPMTYAELIDVLEALPVLVIERRRRLRLSLREAAEHAGVPFNSLHRIERRSGGVTTPTILAVLRWLDSP